MDSLTLVDLLQADSRPTFVVQLEGANGITDKIYPHYINPALCKQLRLREELFQRPSNRCLLTCFVEWVFGPEVTSRATHRYCSFEWHRTLIAEKWLVIGATTEPLPSQSCIAYVNRIKHPQWQYSNDLDWTKTTDLDQLPEYVQYLRSIDWSTTELGPISQWPNELRAVFNLVMRSKSPMILQWGEHLCSIYNEAFIPVSGEKHPAALGAHLEDIGIYEFEHQYASAYRHASKFGVEPQHRNPPRFMLNLAGSLEESYFDLETLPVIGPSTKSCGTITMLINITDSVLAQRRYQTTLAISQLHQITLSVDELWSGLLDALKSNKEDVPFAVAFSTESSQNPKLAITSTGTAKESATLSLIGSVGIPIEVMQGYASLEEPSNPINKALRECNNTLQQIHLRIQDGTLPEQIIDAISSERGHEAGCDHAVLLPLKMPNRDIVRGFLLIGLNPRCPYNESYQRFISLLSAQFGSALAAACILQEEIAKSRRQADLEHALLQQELVEQHREVEASEKRFQRLIGNAVAAICISRPDGSMSYVNRTWMNLFGDTEADREPMAWLSRIAAEDLPTAVQYFGDLAKGIKRGEVEIRLRQKWYDNSAPDMTMPNTWVLVSGYAEHDEDGAVRYLAGILVDISHQKWVQGESQRRVTEATDAKRRQDAFTDMVAHEIRNPLNAIMQCSDVIQVAMSELQNGKHDLDKIQETLEHAETISYCAGHQKKIVNDLLTLSKLDSDLLTFHPTSARPERVIQQAMRMFEGRCKQHDISLSYELDSAMTRYGVDWVLLDTDRTLQVLINLITNAIKFTKGRDTRSIKVRLSMATDPATFASERGIRFLPSKRTQPIGDQPEDDIYILFSVEDSGQGISTEEEQRLFQRFSQASLRTHIDFGGSGLGLWISRELTEMQGGSIGFVPGKKNGGLFAFYQRTKRMLPPRSTAPMSGSHVQNNGATDLLSSPISRLSVATPPSPLGDGQPSPLVDLNKITVLLTEDNIINQKVMQRPLTKYFKQVLIANHGREALDQFTSCRQAIGITCPSQANEKANATKEVEQIDLILMDIEMPVMNGIECTTKIRELEAKVSPNNRIPIIAISANARAEQINEYKRIGLDEVVSKPFLIKDLLAVVRRLL